MKRSLLFFIVISTAQLVYSQTDSTCTDSRETRLKEYPILYQQTAAEYRALCYQSFNIATLRLNQIIAAKTKRPAIITDLDETILDNSYQEVTLINNNHDFTAAAWKEWTNKSAATGVPGAIEFLQKTKRKGVTIFYISNRDTSELHSTLINLKKLKLPDADVSHMLFLTTSSSKEARRQIVMKKYTVVMLLGDNLNDFMNIFEKKNVQERFNATDKMKAEWGRKFIVLPNAAYGEWENAVYDYQHNLTPAEKEMKRRDKLREE